MPATGRCSARRTRRPAPRRSRPAASSPPRPARARAGRRVRAPSRGAVTPGASRTQSRATCSGVRSRPSAARTTASTTPRLRGSRYGSTNQAKWSVAAREPRGVPLRYWPVSTPRPNGDHGKKPMPKARDGGQHLDLGPPGQQRVLHLGAADRRTSRERALPGRRLSGLPADEVRDPGVADPSGGHCVIDGGQGLVQRRVAVGVHLPQVDVVGAQPASEPSRSRSRARREVSTIRSPSRITNPAFVAITISSRVAALLDQPADDPLRVAGAVRGRRVDRACRRPRRNISSRRRPARRTCRDPRSWCRGRAGKPAARWSRPGVLP